MGADAWSSEDLWRFFSEGGTWVPLPPATRQRLLWDVGPCELAPPSLSLLSAHASGTGGLTRIHCMASSGLVLSSSWDATAKLWRLPANKTEDRAVELECLLHDPDSARWVYDAVPFWFGDGTSLGVVTAHTGGMTGEPDQVLRLWHTENGSSGGAGLRRRANTAMRLNTEGAALGHSGVRQAHVRGVHALDATR